ncbi:gamma-bungarotoxin-like [Electrophorus electricus]|uniref:gamma-bungarotoxin-like n=1 Tax=Electrophorus electricus TaxID=8005 RepID=UPI0015CFDF76|nr:gamma-bungarotoxin-like [Electrophorus electricus]
MRTLLVTLVLAMLVMSASTLKCYTCIRFPGDACSNFTEECPSEKNACINGVLTRYPFDIIRRCIRMSDCMLLMKTPGINAVCCQSDHCN